MSPRQLTICAAVNLILCEVASILAGGTILAALTAAGAHIDAPSVTPALLGLGALGAAWATARERAHRAPAPTALAPVISLDEHRARRQRR